MIQPKFKFKDEPPRLIVPKTNDFDDFDPLEIARQLTVLEFDTYQGQEISKNFLIFILFNFFILLLFNFFDIIIF